MVAERQFGVVAWKQLRRRGVADAVVRALAAGTLHRVHHGVYSIVPGACLCAQSAAWWAGLVKERPAEIHVAIAGERRPVPGVRWHRLALTAAERTKHRGIELRGVLAELEYHHGIEAREVAQHPGRTGAGRLRRALADHTPQLAETRSHLERAFADFLTSRNFVLPEFNHPVGMSTVDAIYRDQAVAIELDGVRGHSGERRILRDHRRDLHRRADGLLPIRYHYGQVIDPADQVLIEAELDRLGIPRIA